MSEPAAKSTELLWSPQPGPQEQLVACPLPEVFLGGARGGGKTDGVLGKWLLKERRHGKHFNAVALRPTTTSFQDAIERSRELYQAVLDPSAFAEAGGPSIAERMNTKLTAAGIVAFRPGDNKRVTTTSSPGKRGPMGGWDMMRARLVGEKGRPMLFVFSSCKATCRTMPVLQHDPMKAEDLDTDSEDHAADMIRYACMARPWLKPEPPTKEPPRNDYGCKAQ